MIDSDKIKSVLIIQTAYLGDVILTLPVIQFLKNKFPNIKISFLCIPEVSEILNSNSLIDEVLTYDKKNNKSLSYLIDIIKLIKSKKFDLVISPHRSFRSNLISNFSGVKNRISFDKSSLSFLYNYIVKYDKNKHEILRNFDLLKPLDIDQNEILKPILELPNSVILKVNEFFLENKISERFITIAPGTQWFTKQFPIDKFKNLISHLSKNFKIILIGGKDDVSLGLQLSDNVEINNVVNAIGKFSILESAEIIKRSELLLTNDSAPMHIGNAVNTKVLAIFGSTIPEFGFYPINDTDIIYQVNNLYCRPCGIHGHRECPEKHFRCMKEINEIKISNDINKIMSN